MSVLVLSTATLEEIILNFLTVQSIGRLECTCKTLKKMICDGKVWEYHAVLAWNRFYKHWDELDKNDKHVYNSEVSHIRVEMVKSCKDYRDEVITYKSSRRHHIWDDWDTIIAKMEVIGSGYKTIGFATQDPKIIIQNELERDSDEEDDSQSDRSWVLELKDEIYEETASNESDYSDGSSFSSATGYDSDSSWKTRKSY